MMELVDQGLLVEKMALGLPPAKSQEEMAREK
jgi:hypothetical protein